jgi:hypothetical protein
MRPLRIACFCASLAVPASIIVAACSDPLSSLAGGAHDGGGGGSTDDAPVTIGPTSDDGSPQQPVDAGPPDTGPHLNSVDAADLPEGGLHVTAGVITCGTATCNAFANNHCCTAAEDGGGECLANAVSCGVGGSMACDESADCVVGTVCCGTVGTSATFDDGGGYLSSACAAACTPAGVQLCRTNGECGDAGPCVVQTCSDGNTYEMCGVFAPDDGGGAFSCTPN